MDKHLNLSLGAELVLLPGFSQVSFALLAEPFSIQDGLNHFKLILHKLHHFHHPFLSEECSGGPKHRKFMVKSGPSCSHFLCNKRTSVLDGLRYKGKDGDVRIKHCFSFSAKICNLPISIDKLVTVLAMADSRSPVACISNRCLSIMARSSLKAMHNLFSSPDGRQELGFVWLASNFAIRPVHTHTHESMKMQLNHTL